MGSESGSARFDTDAALSTAPSVGLAEASPMSRFSRLVGVEGENGFGSIANAGPALPTGRACGDRSRAHTGDGTVRRRVRHPRHSSLQGAQRRGSRCVLAGMSGLPRPVSREVAERIAGRLDVIGHPIRVMIVETLDRRGELSVGELAAAVEVSAHDASAHLAVLRGAGIVSRHPRGSVIGYRLEDRSVFVVYQAVAERIRCQIEHARSEFRSYGS
jgi:DNA-binding transcriptional ArsR family regulator